MSQNKISDFSWTFCNPFPRLSRLKIISVIVSDKSFKLTMLMLSVLCVLVLKIIFVTIDTSESLFEFEASKLFQQAGSKAEEIRTFPRHLLLYISFPYFCKSFRIFGVFPKFQNLYKHCLKQKGKLTITRGTAKFIKLKLKFEGIKTTIWKKKKFQEFANLEKRSRQTL